MSSIDYYEVLGVLPTADEVVVKAAYRALAQRYHPDKWRGPAAEAEKRMAEINVAYSVIGNPAKRAEYDAHRSKSSTGEYEADSSGTRDGAFDEALIELEGRWGVAVEVFPDLVPLRKRLALISSALSFSFATILLESKKFNHRHELARNLERQFLERYFGVNEQILRYATELILGGHRDAAKMLNRLVDVMGSDVDPNLLIARVEGTHRCDPVLQEVAEIKKQFVSGKKLSRNEVNALSLAVSSDPSLAHLWERFRGETLLHLCARFGLLEAAATLLKHGAYASGYPILTWAAHR